VIGRLGDRWKVRVAAPPVDGRANDALTRYLSELLDVPAADVRVVSGSGSREKVVEVDGRAGPEIDALLTAAAEGGS
jgi:uncharacterized protein (TIGR00251 family)